MQKNVASQKLIVFAFDSTTNSPKTGDSANLTAYVSKDFGAVTVLGDTTATEMDSTNAKGYYLFDLTQSETNADALLFSAKSSTANIVVIGCPAYVQTVPSAFALAGGASGGFLISGSNSGTTTLAALTVSGATTLTGNVSMAAGLNITQSSSNTSALVVTGNGTGHGIIATSGSGATGDGIKAVSAATNGNALNLVGVGTGAGLLSTGGATGIGISAVGGATSGDAISAVATTSGHGLTATGVGTTKHGINATGGSTTSHGISATGGGVGHGILATSGSGATGDGIRATAASTNGNAINLVGVGTGAGLLATGGATGHGISGVGGATSGNGIRATGTAGNSVAINAIGQGSAAGILSTGGATGHGISAVGGATSGDGISSVASTSGHGLTVTGVGTTKHGINATGGSTTSHGISATGGGVGHGILATSGGGATGDGIRATAASTNGNGLNVLGVGTGAGLLTTGGATGIGLSAVGGATSGDAIKAVTTSGHGLNLAPVGTGMHGLFATGGNGATSDGIKAVAGTGGVPIRGDITGNITGNLSGTVTTVTTLTNLPAITANWLTATGIAADAITAAKIADGAIDRATFAADTGLQNIRANTAQAGAGSSITLDASASATTDYYKNDLVYITGGVGVGQSRFITAYNGTTKVATVNNAWATNPDATSTFAIIPFDSIPGATAPTAAAVATAVWQDATAGDFTVSGSIGKSLFTSGVVPGAAGGLLISGSNSGTTTFGALTVTGGTTFTGAVTGTNASNDLRVNTTLLGGSATPVTNMTTVFSTDFAANYNTTLDKWNANVTHWDAAAAATAQVLSDVRLIMGNSVTNNGTADFDLLDAAISSRSSHTAANVWAVATRTLTSCDVTAISGDTVAADNLESYLDGTLFMPVDAHKPVFSISGATLTVKRPDGTTTAYTRTLATDAAANPVTGSS